MGSGITLIGHMSLLVEMDGVRLLTDPWFGPRTAVERSLAPRLLAPAMALESLPRLDALLVSHGHVDHCDEPSLDLARREGIAVIGPPSVAARARRVGVARVTALRPGERAGIGGLVVHALAAEHPLAADALCFVVDGSRRLFFSGDTRPVAALAAALSPLRIDVALLQAACARYPLLGADGMDLPAAASFARVVRPAWTVPLHLHCLGKWLDRSRGLRIRRDNAEAARRLLEEWAEGLGAEGLPTRILVPGETWNLTGEDVPRDSTSRDREAEA